ncbi:DUF4376 domain-containing protein [Sulfuriferula sp.]|uniref:DUF4376 domain-containing protein n=1 Tax=Sulfuriferula sp. TaxID=2025307 RepID=UPI00272F5992|nr:DUF4376 domain-containing protein [Sulfuriferula sp.]MDP2026459.1 DUF4376 domain-containing protein [Sulfuriferula sp.]
MQTFKDRITGQFWQFDDNVVDIHGFPSTPATLQPYTIPAPTAAQLLSSEQSTQIAAIEAAYQAAIQQPVSYMATMFQGDIGSQDLMAKEITARQAAIALGGSAAAISPWWDAANNAVPMTLLQLQGLFATGAAVVGTAFANKQAKKAAVRAATTVAAVQAITF